MGGNLAQGQKMAKKQTATEKALDRAAELIQAQLDTLAPGVAARKVKELQQIAAKASRPAKTERGRPTRRTGAIRLSSRSRAKIA
jgi:hypothetical protein